MKKLFLYHKKIYIALMLVSFISFNCENVQATATSIPIPIAPYLDNFNLSSSNDENLSEGEQAVMKLFPFEVSLIEGFTTFNNFLEQSAKKQELKNRQTFLNSMALSAKLVQKVGYTWDDIKTKLQNSINVTVNDDIANSVMGTNLSFSLNNDNVYSRQMSGTLTQEEQQAIEEIQTNLSYDESLKKWSLGGQVSDNPYDLLGNLTPQAQQLFKDYNSHIFYATQQAQLNRDLFNQKIKYNQATEFSQSPEEFCEKYGIDKSYLKSGFGHYCLKYGNDENTYYLIRNFKAYKDYKIDGWYLGKSIKYFIIPIIQGSYFAFKYARSIDGQLIKYYGDVGLHTISHTGSGSTVGTYCQNSYKLNANKQVISTSVGTSFSIDLSQYSLQDYAFNKSFILNSKDGTLINSAVIQDGLYTRSEDKQSIIPFPMSIFEQATSTSPEPSVQYDSEPIPRPVVIPSVNPAENVVGVIENSENADAITLDVEGLSQGKANVKTDPYNPTYDYSTTVNNIDNSTTVNNTTTLGEGFFQKLIDSLLGLFFPTYKLKQFFDTLLAKIPLVSDLNYFYNGLKNIDVVGQKPTFSMKFGGFMGIDGEFEVIDLSFYDEYREFIFKWITATGWILVLFKISRALPMYFKE